MAASSTTPWVDILERNPRFEYGGRGPDAYDCYGLVIEMYRRRGVELPSVVSPCEGGRIAALVATELHRTWVAVERRPGVLVVIRTPGSMHVGYVLDDMHFLHIWERSASVVRERLNDWRRRIVGYYDYAG